MGRGGLEEMAAILQELAADLATTARAVPTGGNLRLQGFVRATQGVAAIRRFVDGANLEVSRRALVGSIQGRVAAANQGQLSRRQK